MRHARRVRACSSELIQATQSLRLLAGCLTRARAALRCAESASRPSRSCMLERGHSSHAVFETARRLPCARVPPSAAQKRFAPVALMHARARSFKPRSLYCSPAALRARAVLRCAESASRHSRSCDCWNQMGPMQTQKNGGGNAESSRFSVLPVRSPKLNHKSDGKYAIMLSCWSWPRGSRDCSAAFLPSTSQKGLAKPKQESQEGNLRPSRKFARMLSSDRQSKIIKPIGEICTYAVLRSPERDHKTDRGNLRAHACWN